MRKSVIAKSKKGFTLLELIVSLFLLVILTLLLMLILQTTINTSKRFLDYSNYEYALAHRKILQIYNNSAKVTQEKHYIIMTSKDGMEDVRINFNDNQIYMDKFKNSNDFAGYILLLKHIKGYTLSVEDETIHILIIDKNNHERDMYLKKKDEKTDKEKAKEEKEKEEKEKKEKEEKARKEKENQENNKYNKTDNHVEIEKIKPITNNEEGS
ncbi:prepilin-type N-terminal cleavage/methylation domain-containing protein [Gemella haemolysans]|uniref:prepilin-type N-terminal cleavage/methylation domain-containing protein n=1 Tax=Gemella haemolysans TaxID=1379 RepID=UPI00291243E4|nr:prepilin-type N-terminal cleavage/methylation domain-containing protein [Gemella haemolysans]MDU3832040.1 prepilin-type N-terminal cleavage/methylation domain-containing protein [Gemella haemolysans]